MVDTPLPLSAFLDTVLKHQRELLGDLLAPIISNLALLTLSMPVSSHMLADTEVLIMCFCGVFWIFNPRAGMTGFFADEQEARHYVGTLNDTRSREAECGTLVQNNGGRRA